MRIRLRQAGAKLTLLSWLGPTGGAANRQRLLLTHFHNCIMPPVLNSKLVNSDQPGRSAGANPLDDLGRLLHSRCGGRTACPFVHT
jgi:hypothetical protein